MYNNLSRFDFDIEFIPGKDNHIADALSRLWEVEEMPVEASDFVKEPDLDSLFSDSLPSPPEAGLASFVARFDSDDDDLSSDE